MWNIETAAYNGGGNVGAMAVKSANVNIQCRNGISGGIISWRNGN
jgi:hypothetical protein